MTTDSEIRAQVKRAVRAAHEINAETRAVLKDAVKTARTIAPVGEFTVREIHVYPKKELSGVETDTLVITPNMSEEQIKLQVSQLKAERSERHRQLMLERANRYVNSAEHVPSYTWGTQPSLSELKRRLEQKPPKMLKKFVHEVQENISRYEAYPEMLRKEIAKSLPANWRDFYVSKEEAIKQQTKNNQDKLDAVSEAIGYMREMADAAEEILSKKTAFVNEHAEEMPQLIKKANKLRQTANRLQRRVIEKLRKTPSGLREREVKKIVSNILEHKKIEQEYNVVAALYAKYNPDHPSMNLQTFPPTNYRLPSFIRRAVENVERKSKN